MNPATAGGVSNGGSDFGVPANPSGPALPQTDVTKFEHYEIFRKEDGSLWELGRGAMGITYKARDTDLHVPVALKVINPTTLENSDALERFLREARAAAKLRHANIASVFRLGKSGDIHFYAMEFCEGQTVHQLVERRGPLELRLALEITRQVTEALVVAQDHGVVHRDIKPSNLMVTGRVPDEFTVKVIDFGLAKHTAADATAADITLSSHRRGFVGTAHFASPEQLEDRSVDFRSDIYSLGVTLWFMLTGRPLFEGSLTRVVTQHIMQPAPLEKLSWLPECVAQLLDTMLSKGVEQRPRSTRELRGRLQRCLEEADAGQTMPATPVVRVSPAPVVAAPLPAPPTPPPPAPASTPRASSSTPIAASLPTTPPIPAVGPPPLPPPPPFPAPAPSTYQPAPPPRAQPTQRPVLLIAGAFVFFLLLATAGFFVAPMIKKALPQSKTTDPTQPGTSPDSTPTPVAPSERDLREALRDVRDAHNAAEKLSSALSNADFIRQAMAIVMQRPDHDTDLRNYQAKERANDLNRIDAEQGFLLAAKRINKHAPEIQEKVYVELEDEVSSAGVGWRTRLAQMLPKHVGNVAPDTTQVDPAFLDELKQLRPSN